MTMVIVPYYQRKVALGTGKIVGFEALLRWRDPILSHLSRCRNPSKTRCFQWRLANAGVISSYGKWRLQGVPFGAVAINVSAAEFTRGGLAATTILESVAAFRFPIETLELEVTESVIIDDAAAEVGNALKKLSDNGVGIALDDFGTGMLCSLIRGNCQFNGLRSTGHSSENPESAAIVSMCIELAKSFGIGVVAEAVETADQVEMLSNWNCDVAQGFLFGKPLDAALVPLSLAGLADDERSYLNQQRG